MGEEAATGVIAEIVEGAGQRGHAVHELAHRMTARREEGLVAQGHAQHRQLQPGEQPRHLRRHLGVGQDLVEQTGDDVDDHVVQAPRGGLAQFIAVLVDQVGRQRQLAPGAAAAGVAAERVQTAAHGQSLAVVAGVMAGRHMGEPAQQIHHLRVDAADAAGMPSTQTGTAPARGAEVDMAGSAVAATMASTVSASVATTVAIAVSTAIAAAITAAARRHAAMAGIELRVAASAAEPTVA